VSGATTALAASKALRLTGAFVGAAHILDEHLLALPERGEEDLPEVLLERAHLALAGGAIQEARLRLRELTRIPGGTPGRWSSRSGILAALVGDHATAQRLLWQAIARFRETGNPDAEARAWSSLAMVFIDASRLVDAQGAIACAFAIGPDPEQRASSLSVRGELALLEGDLAAAEACFTESLAAALHQGTPWAAGATCSARAAVRARSGQLALATEDLARARELLDDVPNRWTRAAVEVWAGLVDLAKDQPEQARARLVQARAPPWPRACPCSTPTWVAAPPPAISPRPWARPCPSPSPSAARPCACRPTGPGPRWAWPRPPRSAPPPPSGSSWPWRTPPWTRPAGPSQGPR